MIPDLGAPLEISARREDRTHIVELSGAASMDTADELRKQLLRLPDETAPHLILDLSKLVFISSIGLSALVAVEERARQLGGVTRLVNPTRAVARVLHLTQIDSLLQVLPSLAAAFGSIPPPPR